MVLIAGVMVCVLVQIWRYQSHQKSPPKVVFSQNARRAGKGDASVLWNLLAQHQEMHPLEQNVHEEDNYSSTQERERAATTDISEVIENEAPRTWKRACNCNQNAKATIESNIILHHILIDFSSKYHKIWSQIHGSSWSWYSFIPWISSYSSDPCEPWIFQLSSTQFMWTLDFSFLAPNTPHLPYLGYKFHLLNNTIHTPITQNNARPGLWIVSKWRRLDSYLSSLAHPPYQNSTSDLKIQHMIVTLYTSEQ